MAEKAEDTQDDKSSVPHEELWEHLEQARTTELGTRLTDVQKAIDLGSRSAILLGGACYVAGLLVANLYLGQYGVHNLSILRAQYVLVGALWVFLVASAASFIILASNSVKSAHRQVRSTPGSPPSLRIVGKSLEASLFIGSEFVTWACLVIFVSGYHLWISPAVALRALGILLLSAGAWFAALRDFRWLRVAVADVFILRRGGVRRILKPTPSQLSLSTQAGRGLFELSVRLVLNIGALSAYALYVYPYFPPAIGGGRLPMIALAVAPEHASVLRELGVATPSSGRIFEPLELVMEAGDSFLLALPRNSKLSEKIRSVWIKKDFVDSALYLRDLALHFQGYPSLPTPSLTELPSAEASTPGLAAPTRSSP
jgi:hypothetical protein